MTKKNKGTKNPQITRESAAKTISKLKYQYGERAHELNSENEAKTRLLLVDEILVSLGWSRKDFNPEQPVGTIGYTDYKITSEGISHFIVEAKKVGHTFGNPRHGLRKVDYTLNFIRSQFGQAISDVIKQAEAYCLQTGIPFALLTNGGEWLLIQTIPFNNQGTEDLKCIYFGNFLSNISNFNLFWELLAKENVINHSLEQYFSDLNSLPAEYYSTPSQHLAGINWTHPLTKEKYIQDFYERFFDEIVDPGRRKMLETCFVSNTRLDQYQGDLKRILKDTAPSYIEDATEISPQDYKQLISNSSGDQKGRVILVTGSVGSGKTTLVTKVLVEARQSDSIICLTVDLIDEVSGDLDFFTQSLWKEISQKWCDKHADSNKYETLKEIFNRELKSLRDKYNPKILESNETFWLEEEAKKINELTNSPENFLSRSWRHFSSKNNRGIVVFLDNIDRASDEYQKQVYAFANKLARKTGATVIITMREVTYFRAQDFDFADVRSHTVFHLQTPDLVQILSKRIQYIKCLLDSGDHRLKVWRQQEDWEDFYNKSLEYNEVLKRTLLTAKDSNISMGIFAAISWHNVRYFLRSLKRVHSLLSDSEYWTIPEIIAALMIPTTPIENHPSLANLYIPPYKEHKCYFIKIRILFMLIYARPNSETQRGIGLKSIMNLTRMYRYQDKWSRRAVQDMVKQRLLECIQVPTEATYTKDYILEEDHSFRPSPLALTLIDQIQYDYTYLCMLGHDLPFHNQSILESFLKSFKVITELLEGASLKEGVSLLSETDTGKTVGQYLISCLKDEQPLSKEAFKVPEISIVEEKIGIVKQGFLELIGISSAEFTPKRDGSRESDSNVKPKRKRKLENEDQLSLLSQDSAVDSKESNPLNGMTLQDPCKRVLKIPSSMEKVKSSSTRLEPMIFWALSELRAKGEKMSAAVEVERVINQYLTDDHSKVESTNIARKLRSKTMQNKPWLVTSMTGKKDRKLYSICDEWKIYWQEIFEDDAPDLE